MNTRCLCIILFIFILHRSIWCQDEHLSSLENDSIGTVQSTMIFISDTQTPMWFEKLFAKTHRNEEATKILLNTISDDSTVSSVFFLGDITAMSSFDFNWTIIDSFLTQLKKYHMHAYAVAGNHDYLISSSAGEANLRKRFPDFVRTGYTIHYGSFAIVLLNSNFGELNHSEEAGQREWYLNELRTLEKDTTIKLVVVGCHHPPFSNSTIVGHSQKVRDEFVPPFLKFNKCRLFLSGHAHTFQHFKDDTANKHFLVIGGGGGLLHTLKPDESDVLQDQVKWSSKYRMFHFVRGTLTTKGLLLNVMMLKEDLSGPYSVYEVFIPYTN